MSPSPSHGGLLSSTNIVWHHSLEAKALTVVKVSLGDSKMSIVRNQSPHKHLLCLMVLALSAPLFMACDPEGKKECSWVLEPENKMIGKTDPGMIPVCARNRKTMKEDCRLQTTLEYAQKAYNRKFRYTDLRIESPGLPRTIAGIKFCD